MDITWVPITDVHLNPKNPRHNDSAVDSVAQSLERFGWRQPLVVRKSNGIVEAGNTRLKAALKLGRAEVPVLYQDDDSITAQAYAIADNRTAEIAEWDDGLLVEALRELDEAGRLEESGFDGGELEELAARLPKVAQAPSDFPEYDENIDTSGIRPVECPQCGHEFPV